MTARQSWSSWSATAGERWYQRHGLPIISLGLIWTLVLAASLGWNIHLLFANAHNHAYGIANAALDKDLAYRQLVAGAGGIYAPIEGGIEPNPYLAHIPHRDITTPDGVALTLVNSSYFTRLVHDIEAAEGQLRGRVTSLHPMRAANSPDDWHRQALARFNEGLEEIREVVTIDGEHQLRVMRPRHAQESCFHCHPSLPGIAPGDVFGGLSVSVPLGKLHGDLHAQIATLSGGHLLFGALGWLGIGLSYRRITRQQREREQLLRALQLRNQELFRLSDVLAHHFQEPTRRLVSFARHLQRRQVLLADEDDRLALGFIDSQARRLAALVRDAQRYLELDQRQFESGASTDSGPLLHSLLAQRAEEWAEAQVVVQEPLPTVAVDEQLLREIFGIILDNALRFRHPQRPLRLTVSAKVSDGRANFRFTDNGQGIAPEYRERVFVLFSRLESSRVAGTGIGLAMLQKIAQRLGGEVHIEDGEAGGCSIVLDLPVVESQWQVTSSK